MALADATDLGVNDVVVDTDVGDTDGTGVRVGLDLVAGEHARDRGGDAKVRGQGDLVVGQAVLLDGCNHDGGLPVSVGQPGRFWHY